MGIYKYLTQEEFSACNIAFETLKLFPKLLIKMGVFFLQQLQKDNLAKLKS